MQQNSGTTYLELLRLLSFDTMELLELSGTLVKVKLLVILIAETEKQFNVKQFFFKPYWVVVKDR